MAPHPGRRILIGDVHGHYDGLLALLDVISPTTDDKVHFLGDLIDRGPRSAHVVELVRQNDFNCLLGNHEQLLLRSFPDEGYSPMLQTWLHSGGSATIASYTDWDLLQEHIQWMRALPLYKDLGDFWLVHAGVDPMQPLSQQRPQDFCWIRDEFHSMTRPYFTDKLIVTGHTITFTLPGVAPGELAQGNGWLGIDTGVYHPRSGWLTAIDVDHWKVYQINVFQDSTRVLPFDEVVTRVNPALIRSSKVGTASPNTPSLSK